MSLFSEITGDFVVEPFFADDNEPALIAQVYWLRETLDVSDSFFSNLLGIEEEVFFSWRNQHGNLPMYAREHLREFWQVILHILSFFDFNPERLRVMFYHRGEEEIRQIKLHFDPPWVGTSLKNYLEKSGPLGIREVNHWVQALRFANSY